MAARGGGGRVSYPCPEGTSRVLAPFLALPPFPCTARPAQTLRPVDDPKNKLAERLAQAAEVVRIEAETLLRLAEHLDESFSQAVDMVLACTGQVVVTGMGKAGLVGQKISATLASTGTPSFSLHPAEALHGDLGRVREQDLILALSNSGETPELSALVSAATRHGTQSIAMTGQVDSSLGRQAAVVLSIGRVEEACPLKLAPTASTSAMLALGDALAMVVLSERGFEREDFARFHPAGSLGRQLLTVGEVMRKGAELPLVVGSRTVAEVLIQTSKTPGKPGAALVVDGAGCLEGIFTDGDLRRLLEGGQFDRLQDAVADHMGRDPKTLNPDQLVEEAHRLLRENRIDQAPVVDENRIPVGIVDVQDLLELGE
ncbi:MAG TPA: KpsF/GutQ family sugar-phosphate isomerase [Planctomycetes bacterium]|nr:KpsF/GutQ family sugar-phosphate isomerase [Planctomycetota bacterium]HIK60358.1 KpsF/GutQ family sugar-phosphate isomerase [Planctomycetota bacterium]